MQERPEASRTPRTEIDDAVPMADRRPKRRLLPVLAPILIFAAVAGLFAVALKKGDPSKIPSALIGRAAPQMPLPAVEGLVRNGAAVPGLVPADHAHSMDEPG